jgi:carboxypeptidase Q
MKLPKPAIFLILLASFWIAAADFAPLNAADNSAGDYPLDLAMVTRIRDQGLRHSQVMDTAEELVTVIGPRLTGSPAMKQAAEWARDTLTEWGLENAAIESFEFGRGWSFSRCSVHMVEPQTLPLIALPKAWTPGTKKKKSGEVVYVKLESVEDLEEQKGKLAGKIVFLKGAREIEPPEESPFHRYDDEELEEKEKYNIRTARESDWRKRYRKRREFNKKLVPWLEEEKVLATVTPSGWDTGILRVSRGGSSKAGDPVGVPQFMLAAEHYNRVMRMLDRELTVKLELDIRTEFHEKDVQGYNTVAEIPGSDPDAGVVMIGGHLDSWHGGTGATDNAAGVAMAMEALRILKALDVEPKRTIRIALWDGEEQGLLGSKEYVKRHFASRPETEDPEQLALATWAREKTWPITTTPAHETFSAYFNLDNGGGQIRGIFAQENAAVVPIFERWFEPFHDLGARAVTMRNTGSTDHASFDAMGLPGFQFVQEPMHYFRWTHHSNMDVFDHLEEKDLMQGSVVLASFAYHAAIAEKRLPRKPMPVEPEEDEEPAEKDGAKE